ncbi:MAG TPA: uroporphyrinogen decarboxylase family protein [Phycisphaerae bacterium]|nr:uroporphyrinogen decarboxylase family protein [Phycisphaerae bacterium]
MTSRERVHAALRHEAPDRVPVNYIANPEIDARLKAHYGLAAIDDEGLRQALGVDFRGVHAPYVGPKLHPDIPDRTVDIWGIRRRWVEHTAGGYWDYCDWPLAGATLDEVEAWPLPSPDDFDYAAVAEACRGAGDFCVVAGGGGTGDIINSTGMLRTMEQVLVDLATDAAAGLRLIDRRLAVVHEVTRRTLEAGRGRVDLLWLGEDLGTQRGPLISLTLFRKHIRPRMQRFVDLGKAFGVPVMIHSCGSSSWAFDDFLEMGIAAVDTLQPEPKDMAPAYLKRRWGDRLAFHGMISTAGPVAYGSVADVVANVRETLRIMMPGGGYCLAPTHALQSNSPTENVVAMYDAAREYGAY